MAADTDSDSMDDAWETTYFGDILRNGAGDFDQDGVSDLLEYQKGFNPNLADTDGDGQSDAYGLDGYLFTERWNNVPASYPAEAFSNSNFLQGTPVNGLITEANGAVNTADNYVVRWRGTLVAPTTGDYRFYVAGDNFAQLWFGTGASKFTRRKVAYTESYTSYQTWNTYPAQDSGLIHLEAGQPYYFEVLMGEAGGGDHVSVGWKKPGDTAISIVPGKLTDGTVVLKSYQHDPLDADDDGLLDTWEQTVNLNMGDDGRINAGDGGYSDWDQDGLNNYEEWLTSGNPFARGGNVGVFSREMWGSISGASVANLTSNANFPKPAQIRDVVMGPLKRTTLYDNYGQRLRGVIVPETTGNYQFWVSSDDASELWLSSDASRLHKRKIAYVSGYTAVDAFDATPSQKSVLVPLVAGQSYFYEVLHKEAASSEHVSVAWNLETPNWAYSGYGSTATQSSTYSTMTAAKANDGSTSGGQASALASTNGEANAWWQVDFGQNRVLNRVTLFNRTDNVSIQSRLSNFRISVLDASGNEVTGQNFFQGTGNAGTSFTWDLPQAVTGRKVKIQFLGYNNVGNGYLTLAEVHVLNWKALTPRQIVAANFLRTAGDEPLDVDGDSLPDAWEIQYGLSAADGGAVAFSQGEYGDPDADGVPNLLEYINGTSPTVANGEPGKLQRDTWTNLAGEFLRDLVSSTRFLDTPDERVAISAWQTASRGDYYGQRLRGSVTAPATGWYTFWITGDNECELSLSSDGRKFLKQPIAALDKTAHTGQNEFDRFPDQRSKPIYLVQGNSYFLEVRHKEEDSLDHVAVAWQPPGGSRALIPFSALQSFSYDIDDVDDDDLPDSWESQYALDPADNGSIRRGVEGALGDADGDQLTNREEFLLGTDPLVADSDGDGLSDFVETKSIGSDPNNANSGTGTPIVDYNGSQGTSVTGNWIAGPNGTFLSLDRRGTASWPFTLASAGAKLLEVHATPQGNTWAGLPLTVEITVVRLSDSKRWNIGTFPLRDDEGEATRVLTLLPWLPPGSYKAEIAIRNISESRNVRIDRVSVVEPSGVDADSNGVADWVEDRLGQENGVLSVATTSPVSPVCLEGIARDVSNAALVVNTANIPMLAGTDRRWFANVVLPADGTAQAMTASFENDWLVQNHNVSWTATNMFAGGTVTVRVGDSLRLTAFPGSPDSGAVSITGSGFTTVTTTADVPVVRTFNTAGTFTLNATHTDGASVVTTASITIKVVSANFGSDLLARTDRWREWVLPNVPLALPLEFDSSMKFLAPTAAGAGTRLWLATTADKPVHLIARSEVAGSVAARGTVDPYLIGDAYESGYVEILDTLPDGTLVGRISVVADRLPPGGYVEIQIWAGGAQFADGTTLKKLYAADFDANGQAYVTVYYPSQAAISSFCAYYRLYNASGQLLSGY